MRISKSSIVLVAIVIIIMSLLCKDAASDNPKIRVQAAVQYICDRHQDHLFN